ncbi:MAG: phosphoribosyltransferase family protein [Nanoarchaeota archaeon]
MNWDLFAQEVQDLSKKIDYHPDIIIGITRGGIIPARLLSTYLNVSEMYCLTVRKIDEERKVSTEILENLVDKNILLVEDMLETGRSMIVAKKYLKSKGAKVKTACLYFMPISEIVPDFYLREVQEVQRFPWDS